MLPNFSFLIDDLLAASARPGLWANLTEDLQHAREEGITAVVTLTEDRLKPWMIEEAGLRYLHLPIRDFTSPSLEQVEQFVDFVSEERESGGKVLVHCTAGYGRSGTMLASWLVHEGQSAEDAINEVRRQRPGSIETPAQIEVVYQFEQDIRRKTK